MISFQSSKKKQQKQSSPQKEIKANLSTSATTADSASSTGHTPEQQKLYDSVTLQGDKIRSLKADKAAKVRHYFPNCLSKLD